MLRCAWRTVRRGRERADYWRWVWMYRRWDLPKIMQAIRRDAPQAELHVLRGPGMVRRFVAGIRQAASARGELTAVKGPGAGARAASRARRVARLQGSPRFHSVEW